MNRTDPVHALLNQELYRHVFVHPETGKIVRYGDARSPRDLEVLRDEAKEANRHPENLLRCCVRPVKIRDLLPQNLRINGAGNNP